MFMLWHKLMAQPILLLVAHTTYGREKKGSEMASGDEVRRNISEREMYKTQFEKQTFIIQNEMRQCPKGYFS